MDAKLLLLGLLRQQNMHGYQLYEFIDRDLSVCTDLKKPTAYYLLNKMAEEGLIGEDQVQEGNRPPRRVYSLTEKGEAEYQRLLRLNLADYSPAYFGGDAGLAFIDTLDVPEARSLLERRRTALAEELASLSEVPRHGGSLQLVIDHRLHHLRSELDWLDALVENLAQENLAQKVTATTP
jgi:DNA-binding PadR family transcriptional regulator